MGADCQWPLKAERLGRVPSGRHPRPGRIRAREEPTADLPGPELGREAEERAECFTAVSEKSVVGNDTGNLGIGFWL